MSSLPRTLGIVNAWAYTSIFKYKSNRAYFYKGIMFDKGSPEEGNGSGRSDWGGIPMVNAFIENPPAPFENYQEYRTYNSDPDDPTGVTLRYWGGPWFKDLGTGVTGVARYNPDACKDETIKLHYKTLAGEIEEINLSYYIGDKWSIIIQDNIDGKGRVVLFGCHPEHYVWDWGSGHTVENSDYSEYIYWYPPPDETPSWDEILPPPNDSSDIIQDAAVWIVEPMLD